MRRLVVIADDLTGASDAGVTFADRGLRTTVWLDHSTPLDELDADVLVVDTDSRAATPEDAYARMRSALERVRPNAPGDVVKKIDSTLRGNIGPELRAMLDAIPEALAIVCPAFPAQGRTCRNGTMYVHGTPVDRTDAARDPFAPVHDARVAAHLGVPVAHVSVEALRPAAHCDGGGDINAELDRIRTGGIRVVVADAETDADLDDLASVQSVRDDVLWVGSAGLMHALARRTELMPRERPAFRHPEPVEGCATIVVGSTSATTQQQIAAFAAHPEYHAEILSPAALLDGAPEIALAVERAFAAVARGTDTMIALDVGAIDATLATGAARGWSAAETSRRLREALVATADGIADERAGDYVVLSGGDVARAFCERHGIRGLKLLAQVLPGIPLSRAIGANLFVVTKSGGFGHPETYRDLVALLRTKAFT